MRMGPLSRLYIGQLEDLLQQKNIEYSLFHDSDVVEKIREVEVERAPTQDPAVLASSLWYFRGQ